MFGASVLCVLGAAAPLITSSYCWADALRATLLALYRGPLGGFPLNEALTGFSVAVVAS